MPWVVASLVDNGVQRCFTGSVDKAYPLWPVKSSPKGSKTENQFLTLTSPDADYEADID